MVAIVIPVYNAELYIEKTVNSVLHQTQLPVEIILIDDGSSDNSLQIIQKLEKSSPLIKVYTQKNAGAAITRNRGVEYAKSEWLCFVDADDILHPQRLEIASYFTQGCDAVICDYVRFKSDSALKHPAFEKKQIISLSEEKSAISVLENGYGLPRMLMKKESYLKTGGIDESLVNREDHEFHFRMLTQGIRFRKIEAPLYYYRQYKGPYRLTRSDSEKTFSYKALYKMIDQIHSLPGEKMQKSASKILADRLANIALKDALNGSNNFREHLNFAKNTYPSPDPYRISVLNGISRTLGMGNLESFLGSIRSILK